MASDDGISIKNVRAIKQTKKALLCEIGDEEKWIPQSVIHADSEVFKEGQKGKLVIMAWFSEKEGIG